MKRVKDKSTAEIGVKRQRPDNGSERSERKLGAGGSRGRSPSVQYKQYLLRIVSGIN